MVFWCQNKKVALKSQHSIFLVRPVWQRTVFSLYCLGLSALQISHDTEVIHGLGAFGALFGAELIATLPCPGTDRRSDMQGRGFASSSGAETAGTSWFDWKYFTRTRVNYSGPRLLITI